MEKLLDCCPIAYHAYATPEYIAIQDDQTQFSFSDVDKIITSLAKQLLKFGIKPADRLICIAPNSIELVLLQLTCLRMGIIFSALNPRFSTNELLEHIELLDSMFVYSPFSEESLSLSFIKLNFEVSDKLQKRQKVNVKKDQVISIVFTSGSSGDPKAVMHNYSNHYYSAKGAQQVIKLESGDKNLLSLPLFHISGYATVIRTIIAGATLILTQEKLSTSMLRKKEITHLSLVSTQLYALLEDEKFTAENTNIKHLLLGGSAFSNARLDQLKTRGMTYHLSYGLTEMASQVATSTNGSKLKILPYREIKMLDNEIQVRGETCFVGYFNHEKRSSNEWFSTKDIGSFQPQTQTLTISGRKDRLFISGGENIQPEEIEKILLSFSEITQAHIIPIEDKKYGCRPVAFLNQEISLELRQKIAGNLSYFKRPIYYFKLPDQTGLKVSLKVLSQSLAVLVK